MAASSRLNRVGGWNDQPSAGDGGLGKFPTCETNKPHKHADRVGEQTINGVAQ